MLSTLQSWNTDTCLYACILLFGVDLLQDQLNKLTRGNVDYCLFGVNFTSLAGADAAWVAVHLASVLWIVQDNAVLVRCYTTVVLSQGVFKMYVCLQWSLSVLK